MRISKYISVNLIFLFFLCLLLLTIYIFCFCDLFSRFIQSFYISLDLYSAIFTTFFYLECCFIGLFFVEKFVRKKNPTLLPKINFKNVTVRKIHSTLIGVSFYLAIFCVLGCFILFLFISRLI